MLSEFHLDISLREVPSTNHGPAVQWDALRCLPHQMLRPLCSGVGQGIYLFLVRLIHDGLLFRLNLLCCFCRSFRGCFPFRPERLALVVIRFLLGARGSRTSVIASSPYLKTADIQSSPPPRTCGAPSRTCGHDHRPHRCCGVACSLLMAVGACRWPSRPWHCWAPK